jgi:malate dehydrogenase
VVYSYPVRCVGGAYEIVQGLAVDAFGRTKLDATDAELREERTGVAELL